MNWKENSQTMGPSAYRQPKDQHNTMPEDTPPVKILRTPSWNIPLPNEPYLFFGTTGGVRTYYYRYVVYNTFHGSPKFKELLYGKETHEYYVSPDPIDMDKIDNNDLKELKRFLQLERTKNNGNSSFCTRIFESLSDININS
jgi:hypothetical protein